MNTWTLILIFTSLLVATSLEVNCQIQECTFQGIDLQQCLDQGSERSPASLLSCCESLNQAIQVGYYCICKLIGSTTPLLSNSLVLPVPDCFISIPPLTQCEEPVPVLMPPDSPLPKMKSPPARPLMPPELPKWQMQPSDPPFPPNLNDSPLKSTPNNSSSVVANQPALIPELGDPEHGVQTSYGGNKNRNWLQTGRLLLAAALDVFLA